MPRPGLPPTPAPSTDLQAKERYDKSTNESAFNLPPPAIASAESSVSSNASVKSDSSYRPTSPTSSRKRSRTAESSKSIRDVELSSHPDISLPPPPTRSRRIIQMKPGMEKKGTVTAEKMEKKKSAGGSARSGSTTTAAGRKTARKTAHSIIERRRRSKMNEEFETLKGMIPACRGQSMHKLAILQAGIDYMRYLEQCVADLKGANRAAPSMPLPSQSQAPTPRPQSPAASEDSEGDDDDDGDDQEMEDAAPHSPPDISSAVTDAPSRSDSRGYTPSHASPYVVPQKQAIARSTNTSALPSPAFGPRTDSWSSIDRPALSYIQSSNASPVIAPDAMAQEATAALLMLNTDRRYSRSERTTQSGGLSVRDLLSS